MGLAIRIALGLLVVLMVFASAGELWARWPSQVRVRPANIEPDAKGVVILFHGRGGAQEPTMVALEQRFRGLVQTSPRIVVLRYLWAPYSDTRFRGGANGTRVGDMLGRELAKLQALDYLHLVGHSAGAYILDPLCNAYRAAGGKAQIDITYLDPIGFRGLFDTRWGVRTYGKCADYAEAWINTDDPVPATNEFLQHAWNVDVTRAPGKDSFTRGGHRWPVQYYANQLTAKDLDPGSQAGADRSRGAVVVR